MLYVELEEVLGSNAPWLKGVWCLYVLVTYQTKMPNIQCFLHLKHDDDDDDDLSHIKCFLCCEMFKSIRIFWTHFGDVYRLNTSCSVTIVSFHWLL